MRANVCLGGPGQDKNYWFSSFDTLEEGDEPRESEIFTAWVALSDVGTADGPMMLLRGSRESSNDLPWPSDHTVF